MREPDEQAVLDHACNTIETIRERPRIGDPPQRGVENPVPAVRDESVTILGGALHQGTGATGGSGGGTSTGSGASGSASAGSGGRVSCGANDPCGSTENCEFENEGCYDKYFETSQQIWEYAEAVLPLKARPKPKAGQPPLPQLPVISV